MKLVLMLITMVAVGCAGEPDNGPNPDPVESMSCNLTQPSRPFPFDYENGYTSVKSVYFECSNGCLLVQPVDEAKDFEEYLCD